MSSHLKRGRIYPFGQGSRLCEAFWRTIDQGVVGGGVASGLARSLVLYSYVDRLDIDVLILFLAYQSRFCLYDALPIAVASP
jgi:hypothetical protein